jgi:hypothetical protein
MWYYCILNMITIARIIDRQFLSYLQLRVNKIAVHRSWIDGIKQYIWRERVCVCVCVCVYILQRRRQRDIVPELKICYLLADETWSHVDCMRRLCLNKVAYYLKLMLLKMVKGTLISLQEYQIRVLLNVKHWFCVGCLTTLISLQEYQLRVLLNVEHWFCVGCLTHACRRGFCLNAGPIVAFYVVEWSVQTVARSRIALVETLVALLANLTVCIIFEVIPLRSTTLKVPLLTLLQIWQEFLLCSSFQNGRRLSLNIDSDWKSVALQSDAWFWEYPTVARSQIFYLFIYSVCIQPVLHQSVYHGIFTVLFFCYVTSSILVL